MNLFGSKTDIEVNIWERIDSTKPAENKTKYNLSRTGLLSSFNTFATHGHMIEPDTYFLKKLTYEKEKSHHTMTLPSHSTMVFKVKAGEVVYIGDLQVTEESKEEPLLSLRIIMMML